MFIMSTISSDWWPLLFATAARQGVGFLLSLGLWRFYRRWPATDFKIQQPLASILAACLTVTLIDFAAVEGLRRLFGQPPLPPLIFHGIWLLRAALYIAWTALYFLIRHQMEARNTAIRLARAEAASREAELLQLRAQMNPHFLFNALSNIIAQADQNPDAVAEATHAVADYLRYSLMHSTHYAPLGAELEAMRNYLRIETAVRGANRISWEIDASPECERAITPTALVQPLIENGIKYGMRTSPTPLRLRVEARVANERLRVAVENTGEWIERDPGVRHDSTGIGLANLRRRLELLYEGDAQLTVSTPPGRIRIEVDLPLRVEQPAFQDSADRT